MKSGSRPDRKYRIAVIGLLLAALILWASYLDPPFELADIAPVVGVVEEQQSVPIESTDLPARETRSVADPESCPPYDASLVLSSEQFAAIESNAVSVLRSSSDPEHLFAAALLSRWRDPPLALELLDRSIGESSVAPLSAWSAFIICGQRPNLGCDFANLEADAIRVDGRNGAMWVQVAASRLESGRKEEAVEAMRQAIAAPSYMSFHAEQILVVERALASATDLSLADRFARGSTHAAAAPTNFRSIMTQCEAEKEGVWQELCEQLGRRMATDADDVLNRALGLSLQKSALGNSNDGHSRVQLRQQRERLSEVIGTVESTTPLLNLLIHDENILRDYLSNLEVYGELEAWERLSSEAERLRSQPGYDQCNFEGDPYNFDE